MIEQFTHLDITFSPRTLRLLKIIDNTRRNPQIEPFDRLNNWWISVEVKFQSIPRWCERERDAGIAIKYLKLNAQDLFRQKSFIVAKKKLINGWEWPAMVLSPNKLMDRCETCVAL